MFRKRSRSSLMTPRLHNRVSILSVLFVGQCLSASTGGAQGSPGAVQLDGEYDHRFTSVTSVRELKDKSLLVVDRGEAKLFHVVSLESAPVQLGRKGEGPNEYKSPRELIALGGDSTLFTDSQLRRWHLLVGSSFRVPAPWPRDFGRTLSSIIAGYDRLGRVYWTNALVPVNKRGSPQSIVTADSMVLQRVSVIGGRIDTLARLRAKHGAMKMVVRRVLGVETNYALNDPMRVPDQVAVCNDGWIAIALSEARRIDWIRTDGRRVFGPPLPRARVPVTEAVKRDAIVRYFNSAEVARYFSPGDFPAFPAVIPPFQDGGVECTSDGRVVVQRYDLLEKPVVYDLVARDGSVGTPLTFPPKSEVVGQSDSYIYVVTPDEDDLQILRRYRWR